MRAKIESFAENRFVLVELATHVHVLRALAGKQKHRRGTSRGSGNEPFAIETGERGNGLSHVFDDDGAAVRKCRAPQLASESNVGKIQFRMLCKMRGKICKGLIGGAFGLCGNRENFGTSSCWRVSRTAAASSTITCALVPPMPSEVTPARRGVAARGPIGELAVYVKRTASKLDVRIDLLEMQAGGNLRVLQRKHGLDEASNAGRCIEMADVGFQRADSRSARAPRPRNACVRARTSMGSPTRGSGAVGFHIGDAGGRDASVVQRFANHFGLAFHAGRKIAHLARAIIVDCRAKNHSANVIVIGERIFKPAQDNDPQAACENRAARAGVEDCGSGRRAKESRPRDKRSRAHAEFRWSRRPREPCRTRN